MKKWSYLYIMNHFIVYILGIIDRFFNLQHVKFMAEAMEKFKNGVVDLCLVVLLETTF